MCVAIHFPLAAFPLHRLDQRLCLAHFHLGHRSKQFLGPEKLIFFEFGPNKLLQMIRSYNSFGIWFHY